MEGGRKSVTLSRTRLAMVNAQRPPHPKYPLPFSFLYTGCHGLQEASQPETGVGCEPFSLLRCGFRNRSSPLELCAVGALRPLGRAEI